MRVLVKLYNMVDPAADGSVIPRQQTEQYLNSEDYRTIISDKLALCGFTHKDRVLDSKYKNVVGPDDQVLINNNSVGYIEKIFLREAGDKYCYAFIKVFDPQNFSGALKDNITNFSGMMEEGVKLPSSVVIQAMWSPSGRAERIIRIKGMDFTMNPSFKGSGTIKMMSVKDVEETDTKTFSDINIPEGHRIATRKFSMGEIEIEKIVPDNNPNAKIIVSSNNLLDSLPDSKSLTRSDIISMFGAGSDIALRTRSTPVVKVKVIKSIVDGSIDKQLEHPIELLMDQIRDGAQDDLRRLVRDNSTKVIEIMATIPKNEPNYDSILKPKLLDILSSLQGSTRVFSTVRSIKDRMISAKFPKQTLMKRTLESYKQYYSQNKSSMMDKDRKVLESLLKQDIKWLISIVSDRVYGGQSLSTIYNLSRYGNEIHQAGTELSKTYRRLMISEKIMGFSPVKIREKYVKDLSQFNEALMKYLFNQDGFSNDNEDL